MPCRAARGHGEPGLPPRNRTRRFGIEAGSGTQRAPSVLRGIAAPMSPGPVKTKKNIHFEFSQELVKQPLLYQLNRQFDVVINIRGASVTDEGGFIALELEGDEAEVARVITYLRDKGVQVSEGLGGAGR
jgi:ABC-type methionine transport system ATPase subunit